METYFYKCDLCGFVHLVPAYWVGFNPESVYEMGHINADTGEVCACMELKLKES